MSQREDAKPSDRQGKRPTSVPQELLIAAGMLVVIMAMTSLALWLVTGQAAEEPASVPTQSQAVPTTELLEALAQDLGPQATPEELEHAVGTWLSANRSNDVTPRLVALGQSSSVLGDASS